MARFIIFFLLLSVNSHAAYFDSVEVSNFPATQDVNIVGGSITGFATEATLSAFKTQNNSNLLGVSAELTAFKSANHADLLNVISAIGTTNGKLDTVIAKDFATSAKQDLALTAIQALTKPADSQLINGTVTANIGTTNGLALDTSIASTNTKLDTAITKLTSIDGKDFATQTTLAAIKAKTDNIDVASSTLSTSALQTSANTKLDTVNTNLNTINTTLGTPLQAGGNVAVTNFPAQIGLTDTQLRATPVPVSGTLTTSLPTNYSLETGGNLAAINSKITAVNTGAVVVSSSALPTGAATETTANSLFKAGQNIGNTSFIANAGTNLNTSLLALDSTVAKDASLGTLNTSVNTLLKPADTLTKVTTVDTITNPVAMTAAALPLPSGASTSALQTTGNNSLSAIDGKLASKTLSTQVVGSDIGLITNSVIHGLTTAGGGSYVDVKVNPSGALSVDASNSTGLTGTFTANAGTDLNTSALNLEATQSAMSAKLDNGTQKTKLVDASGNTAAFADDGNGGKALEVSLSSTTFVYSAANSTTVQLAAAATFTGTVESVVNQQSASVLLTTDQNGILTLREFIDVAGLRKTRESVYTIVANVPFSRSFVVNGNYFRAAFQNTGGSTTTTLNLNVAYGTIPAATALGNSQVSLDEVNGTAITLGQKTMAASLPVVLASDSVTTNTIKEYNPGISRLIAVTAASASIALSTTIGAIKKATLCANGSNMYFTIGNGSATATTSSHWLANGTCKEWNIDLTLYPAPFIAAIRQTANGTLQISEMY